MRRIILPIFREQINKSLNNWNTYQTEFRPNYELTYNDNKDLEKLKLRGIRFHVYKNYGLLRKNNINIHNEEFQTFLFGDKIKSQ